MSEKGRESNKVERDEMEEKKGEFRYGSWDSGSLKDEIIW